MLSAVLKRVKSLEKRLDKQGNNIEELKRRINGPLLTESDKISSVADIKEILLRYQAKLKEQGFEMNHIKSKITTQEENVQKIKLDLIRLRSEKQRVQQYESQQQQQQQVSNSREQLALDRTQAYNPAVECLLGRGGSYHGPLLPNVPIPPQLAPGNYLETQPNVTEPGPMYNPSPENNADHSRSTEAIVADRCLEKSAGTDSAALWHNFINNKLRVGSPAMSGIDLIMQQQQEQMQLHGHGQTVRKSSNEFCNAANNNAMNLQRELSFYKRRVVDLEAECVQKDRLLQELASKQEEYKEREKEFLQKFEWCEHKMRLLKQDKRRRGETIGKLLRSIDEMKDSGKLDLARVHEGRGILATTLNTRGLSNEQRIQAAINITDTEKAPRYRELLARVRTSESSTHSGSDETDSEVATPRLGDA